MPNKPVFTSVVESIFLCFIFRIICPVGCGRKVTLQEFVAHKASCIPSDEINKIVGNTLRSMIEQSGSNTIKIKTGGQVGNIGFL